MQALFFIFLIRILFVVHQIKITTRIKTVHSMYGLQADEADFYLPKDGINKRRFKR